MGETNRSQRQNKRVRLDKIRRLRDGHAPRVLDLFSGCGGMSLGFHREGFQIAAAVEIDELAAKSHAFNFHRGDDPVAIDAHSQARDITKTDPADLSNELGLGSIAKCIDVLVGGPPCQSYARVGRAKLREVYEHPTAFKIDPRANLYLRYLEYVRQYQPIALVMENVPDILNNGGHNIAEEMCDALSDMGYSCKYTLLNAAFYGVPQMRERAFLIGFAEELDATIQFPNPSHWIQLPTGYQGSRDVALRTLRDQLGSGLFDASEGNGIRYVAPPEPTPDLLPAITAKEAIGDLPPITLHLEGKLRRGARRLDQYIAYPTGVKPSRYAASMRKWEGFQSPQGIPDHVIRSLPRDYMIFRRMNPGDQYPQAIQHALDMLDEEIQRLKSLGETIKEGTRAYDELRASMVPPYDPGKFPNKWRKLESDKPSRTLMAHIGKDTYSHIHYDSDQARTISVREAARLQSFPDGFLFCGTMNPAFRQIGNAVPPLMSAAIAKAIMQAIQGKKKSRHRSRGLAVLA
ncbi:MAG: DNA cytosine methyltransferase [Planctomycetaceae bacterium]